MNINVVGISGLGKFILVWCLVYRLGLFWIEFDCLYWWLNWQGVLDEVFFVVIVVVMVMLGWVLDGNYNCSCSVKWWVVDLVIWVDYGFWCMLCQVVWWVVSWVW